MASVAIFTTYRVEVGRTVTREANIYYFLLNVNTDLPAAILTAPYVAETVGCQPTSFSPELPP